LDVLSRIERKKDSKHGKYQILGQSGKSQNGSDMDSTSNIYSHFSYSDHLGDWRRYNGAGMVVIVGQSGFWANTRISVCIHISSRQSSNLLSQDFKQCFKTQRIVMVKRSQQKCARMTQGAVIKFIENTKILAGRPLHSTLIWLCTTFKIHHHVNIKHSYLKGCKMWF
jgi:hypothetical protein